jgi:hypothetical protein
VHQVTQTPNIEAFSPFDYSSNLDDALKMHIATNPGFTQRK